MLTNKCDSLVGRDPCSVTIQQATDITFFSKRFDSFLFMVNIPFKYYFNIQVYDPPLFRNPIIFYSIFIFLKSTNIYVVLMESTRCTFTTNVYVILR